MKRFRKKIYLHLNDNVENDTSSHANKLPLKINVASLTQNRTYKNYERANILSYAIINVLLILNILTVMFYDTLGEKMLEDMYNKICMIKNEKLTVIIYFSIL